jgi:hypothetical protein
MHFMATAFTAYPTTCRVPKRVLDALGSLAAKIAGDA